MPTAAAGAPAAGLAAGTSMLSGKLLQHMDIKDGPPVAMIADMVWIAWTLAGPVWCRSHVR